MSASARVSRPSRPCGAARRAGVYIVKKVWPYVLAGVGFGPVIHGWVPESFISAVLGDENPFSVAIATFVGVPMYADIFGTLPITEALVTKGVGIGTVLAFMMAAASGFWAPQRTWSISDDLRRGRMEELIVRVVPEPACG